jgi:hypothetical protein
MRFSFGQAARTVTAGILLAIFAIPMNLLAQTHVVSPSELHKDLVNATQQRRANQAKLQRFFSSPSAHKALQSVHMSPVEVQKAVSSLSDSELAQLAARADKAQADVAAGNLSDRDLLVILIGIAALILIIVAVR